MIRHVLVLAGALALAGCFRANLPVSQHFGPLPDVPTARLFVDADGRFYPERWQHKFPIKKLRRAKTIDGLGLTESDRAGLDAQANAQLAKVAEQMRGKKRVFILVHGYNTKELETVVPYDVMTERFVGAAKLGRDDIVIRFHWDGLVATTPGGEITSWFKAVGYSQTAGMLGLRRLLDLAHDQDVYLVSHSRGASVILSALADPPFPPKLVARTEALIGRKLAAPSLAENGNRIHAIFLAPAIGKPDFWSPSCAGKKTCDSYRPFSPQLVSLRYTVNLNDKVLKKGFRQLASKLHATDLGYDPAVGESLRGTYPCLTGTTITEKHGHKFVDYVHDAELTTMLAASVGDTRRCTR